MTEWSVIMSNRARADLDAIYEYIAFTLLEPENAYNQTMRIRNAISSLNYFPERCPSFTREPLRSQGLRYLMTDNYVTVFKLSKQKNVVTIVTINYAKRNLINIV